MNFQEILSKSKEIKLKNQIETTKIQVNFIKAIKSSYGNTYICYYKKENEYFYSNLQLTNYFNKMCKDLKKSDGYFYYKDEELSPLLEFIISSKVIKDDKTIVKIEFIKNKVDDNTIS